jgi:hypothetical protein
MICDMGTVSCYLQEIKEVISNPSSEHEGWVLVPRPENIMCVTDLGLKNPDIVTIILGLSVADYCEGPCRDNSMPGDIWIFGKWLEETEMYIKLKLAKFGPIRRVRIISFHPAKDDLVYPFRE